MDTKKINEAAVKINKTAVETAVKLLDKIVDGLRSDEEVLIKVQPSGPQRKRGVYVTKEELTVIETFSRWNK